MPVMRSQYSSIVRWRPLPYGMALVFTLVIFGFHMLPNMDSMLNENNTRISHGFLKSQIDYHQEIAPFARRPLTSFLIESAISHLNLRAGHAFILINFTLLFLSGVVLFRLSKTLKATKAQALTNLCVYFLSFSVLFAFFPPVFSYDEPLQYCLILLSLTAFVRKRWPAFVALFTLALIARETSMLLLPALLCFAPGLDSKFQWFSKAHLRFCIPVLLPLLFYGIYLAIFIHSQDQLEATRIEMGSRYSCFLENFESTRNTVESMVSLFLALGPFLYLTLFGKKRNKTVDSDRKQAICAENQMTASSRKKWISAFLLTAIVNTPIVILTAFARETRLFALPLLLLWPVFAQLFEGSMRLLAAKQRYSRFWQKWTYPTLFFFAMAVNYWFCFRYYPAMGLGENTFFGEYLFLTVLVILLHLLLRGPNKTRAPGI